MRVILLGDVRIERGGSAHAVPGRQAASVFAFLALHRDRSVSKDELAEVLWPDRLPSTWEASLRVLISRLRSYLAENGLDPKSTLPTGASGYRLNLPSDASVDVDLVTDGLASAEDALAAGRYDSALDDAQIVVDLAAGPILLRDDARWLDPWRDRVARARLRALEIVSAGAAAKADHRRAIQAAAEAVDLDPLREAAHRSLMGAHVAAGDRASALVAYERCRTLLSDELGTDPSSETQALHQQILRMRDVGVAPRATVPGPLRAPSTVFVGREEELTASRDVLDRAFAHGTEVVLVSGEAGIGKTRLCAEIARHALDRGAVALYGRCDEEPLGSYDPFVEAIARRIREWPALATIVAPELVRILPGVGSDTSSSARDPQTERFRLFEGVTDTLEAVAGSEGRGVLLVLDDLHWADRSTLRLLEHVVCTRPESPLAVVGAYRGAELPPLLRDAIAEIERTRSVTRLHLSGLTSHDVQGLLEESFAESTPDLARALVARTEGNPFFALEILRHLREGTEEVTFQPHEIDVMGVPAGIRDVIRRRLSWLSEDAQHVLLMASVIGRQFDLSLAERLAREDVDALLVLEEAAAGGLVSEIPDAVGEYRFAHHLVRQVLYDDLSPTRRARLHLRVGEALEEVVGASPGPRAVELAHHFAAAAPVGDIAKALRYSELAGDRAREVLAFEDAAEHYTRALALVSEAKDDVRARLLISLADAKARSGDVRTSWRMLGEALPFARRAGILDDLGATLVTATSSLATNWDHTDWSTGESSLAELSRDDAPVRSIFLSRMALLTQAFGTPPDAQKRMLPLSIEAHEMAERTGDPTALAAAIQARILCDTTADLLARRLELLHQLIALSNEIGNDSLRTNTHLWLGREFLARGEIAEARASMEAFDRLGAATGHPWSEWRSIVWHAGWAILTGDLRQAEEMAKRAFEVGRDSRVPQAFEYYGGQLTQIRREQGRLAEVEDALVGVAERARTLKPMVALLYAESGRPDEAAVHLDDLAADGFARISSEPAWPLHMACLASVCDCLRDAERAAVLYGPLRPYEGRHLDFAGMMAYGGPVDLALGTLAATTGDRAVAERHLMRALEMCDDVGAPTWKARTQFKLGALMLDDNRDRALPLLSQALATAERIGMRGLVTQIRAAARDLGPR